MKYPSLLFLSLSLGVLAGCPLEDSKDPDDKETGNTETGPDGDATGSLAIATPADGDSGDISVTVTAIHPDSPDITLSFQYSIDGTTFAPATVSPLDVSSGPDPGVDTRVTWDTMADFGSLDATAILQVSVDGDPSWGTAVTDSFFVDNGNNPPEISVTTPTATLPSGAVDGDVVIPFTVSDSNGDRVDVTVTYDGTKVATPASTSPSMEGLSPGSYEFVWDTMQDLGATDKTDVVVTMTPNDGEVDGDPDSTGSFNVENDPEPGIGEIVVAEYMRWPVYTTKYIEVLNLTNHTLTADGLVFGDMEGDFTEVTAAVDLLPHDVLAWADDPSVFADYGMTLAGAYDPLWSRSSDTIIIQKNGVELFRMSYNSADWPYTMGASMQLTSTATTAEEAADPTFWCDSVTAIDPSVTDLGTPGWANDDCGGQVEPPPDYMTPAYFFPEYAFGWQGSSVLEGLTYGGSSIPNTFAIWLAPEEYTDTWDDALLCSIVWEADFSTTSFSSTYPIDVVASLGTAVTDCVLDPAVWGEDPSLAFSGSEWGAVVGELTDGDLIDWGLDPDEYLGGDVYIDGVSMGDGAQSLYGYSLPVDDSEIDDSAALAPADLLAGDAGYVMMFSAYIYYVE